MSLTFPNTISGLDSDERRLYRTLLRRLTAKRKRNRLRRAYMDGRNELHDIGYASPPTSTSSSAGPPKPSRDSRTASSWTGCNPNPATT